MKFAEDLFYVLDCSAKANSVVISNDLSYIYNDSNAESMTKNLYSDKYIKNFVDIVKYLRDFMRQQNLTDVKYIDKLSSEYVLAAKRILKTTTFRKAIKILNNREFREGISDLKITNGTKKQKILFALLKFKLYWALLLMRFK